MRILALDPATKCGFAFGDSRQKKPIASGTWDLSTRRDESAGMKLIRLRNKLEEFAALQGGLEMIVYETPALHSPYPLALVSHSKLVAAIEVFAHDHKIEYRGTPPSELKKFTTGKGNANKEAMTAAVKSRWNVDVEDDNEADAVALYFMALAQLAGVAVNPLVAETPLLDPPAKKDDSPF